MLCPSSTVPDSAPVPGSGGSDLPARLVLIPLPKDRCHSPAVAPLFPDRKSLLVVACAVLTIANPELAAGHPWLSHPSNQHRRINPFFPSLIPIQCLGFLSRSHRPANRQCPGPFPRLLLPCQPPPEPGTAQAQSTTGWRLPGKTPSGFELTSLCRGCLWLQLPHLSAVQRVQAPSHDVPGEPKGANKARVFLICQN